MIMNCYKCGTDKELSIKARHRDGRVRIRICRQCRVSAYHQKPYKTDYTKEHQEESELSKWLVEAENSYLRVFRVRRCVPYREPQW